jgi:hypothetical protein
VAPTKPTTKGEIMSSVIRFLETMGKSAGLRHAVKPVLYRALSEHQVDQDAQWAILRGDQGRLETLLGARTEMVCFVALPDSDDADIIDQEIHLVA